MTKYLSPYKPYVVRLAQQDEWSRLTELLKIEKAFITFQCQLRSIDVAQKRSACFDKKGNITPGSHMPPTYLGLGHRDAESQSIPDIDRRLACEVELNSTSQASRRLSAMKIFYVNIISSADATYFSKKIRSIFKGKMVKNCVIRFALRANLSTSAIHRRCSDGPTGTDQRTLSVATGGFVAGRSAGCENQA